jgi:hypothetical protein
VRAGVTHRSPPPPGNPEMPRCGGTVLKVPPRNWIISDALTEISGF